MPLEQDRDRFDATVLREKANSCLADMDQEAVTDRFNYLHRHWWVTKDFARGSRITACICNECVHLGPIA
jgi:hypothetical protein